MTGMRNKRILGENLRSFDMNEKQEEFGKNLRS
jgi:hypothetical protein